MCNNNVRRQILENKYPIQEDLEVWGLLPGSVGATYLHHLSPVDPILKPGVEGLW